MDLLVILNGIATLIFALIFGILALYLGFKAMSLFLRKINEDEELLSNNIAVAILHGSFIFALAYISKSSLFPLVQTMFHTIFHKNYEIMENYFAEDSLIQ